MGTVDSGLGDRQRLTGSRDRSRPRVGGRIRRYRIGDRSVAITAGPTRDRDPAIAARSRPGATRG